MPHDEAGDPVDQREVELDADPAEVARLIMLDALTRRAHTRAELAAILAKRNVPCKAVEEVLDRFSEVGLIDDASFAAAWVESRQQRRHLSKRALRNELQRKGIDEDVVEEAVSVVNHDDEYTAALELAKSRACRTAGLAPQVRLRRLAGVLARKGFSTDIVMRACREVLDETVDDDSASWS